MLREGRPSAHVRREGQQARRWQPCALRHDLILLCASRDVWGAGGWRSWNGLEPGQVAASKGQQWVEKQEEGRKGQRSGGSGGWSIRARVGGSRKRKWLSGGWEPGGNGGRAGGGGGGHNGQVAEAGCWEVDRKAGCQD